MQTPVRASMSDTPPHTSPVSGGAISYVLNDVDKCLLEAKISLLQADVADARAELSDMREEVAHAKAKILELTTALEHVESMSNPCGAQTCFSKYEMKTFSEKLR